MTPSLRERPDDYSSGIAKIKPLFWPKWGLAKIILKCAMQFGIIISKEED